MTKVLGFYLWLTPILFFLVGGADLGSHPLVVALVWSFHVLALILYTFLVDDNGYRRGWEVCENTVRQPPGPI